MDGYNFCKKILEHPNGGVEALLKQTGNSECDWLELKASVKLLPEDQEKGNTPEDLYWSIANAVISMMNTYGGAVIIGIDDKSHKRVPFIAQRGMEAFLRCEIYDKIWSAPGGTKNWGTKNNFHVKSPLPELIEIKSFPYQDGDVAVILVQPKIPCLRIWKGQVEEIRIRARGSVGETKEIIGSEAMSDYDNNQRKIEATAPFLDEYYHTFVKYADSQNIQRRKKITIEWCIIILLVCVSSLVWILPAFSSISLKILICLGCALFAFFVLPVFFPPKQIPPIRGMKTPDQIIVDHPLPTIEGLCLNNKHWWIVSDSIETCYGTWEMQRHKVFGNLRIVDPRNIVRCWGTQKMVIPVFEKIKAELETECPPQKESVPAET